MTMSAKETQNASTNAAPKPRDASRSRQTRPKTGYKQPPVKHRFRPGVSGNPAGRPRKAAPKADDLLGATESLLIETSAPVDVIENGIRKKMSTIQATVRRAKVAALNGDGVSARRLLTVSQAAERRRIEEHRRNVLILQQYKHAWKAEIERCRLAREPVPEPIPHPDEIVIDARSGEVRFNGPVDEREANEWQTGERRWNEEWIRFGKICDLAADPATTTHSSHFEQAMKEQMDYVFALGRRYPPTTERRDPEFDLKKHRAEEPECETVMERLKERDFRWRMESLEDSEDDDG